MASIFHLVPDALPASEHPSLNLDLSLGGIFSDQHNGSSETMATAESGVTDCRIAAPSSAKRWCAADSSSPAALYVDEPVHLPSPKLLQAQRWHAARKRRKSIIEEKLHKRYNGDNFSLGQTRLADVTLQGFEWDGYVTLNSCPYTPCLDSPKDQCVPCSHSPSVRSLFSQAAQQSAASIPTCASSSSICTLTSEKKQKLDATARGEGVDGHDDKQRSPNSSSSGLEHEYARSVLPNESSDTQSSRCNSKDGLNGASSSMAFPHIAQPPVMPASYPHGFPAHWRSSLPWFTHFFAHMAVHGAESSMAIFPEKVSEATSLPRTHTIPYNPDIRLPAQDMASPFQQSIPASGTANIFPTECGQEKMDNGASDHSSTAHADVDDKVLVQVLGDNTTSKYGQLENVAVRHDGKENPSQKMATSSLDANEVTCCKQLQKRANNEETKPVGKDSAAGERHHSLPDSCGRVSKKAKFVRFNSLDNKVIQLEQEQPSSHSYPLLNGELLENDASADTNNDDGLERLHARRDVCDEEHFHDTCGKNRKITKQIDAHLDETHISRKVDKPADRVHLQSDEEEDAETQSHTSVVEDDEEDQYACMPRVTTRGSGPLGKIIHGVMYITKEKQARLICSCHGKHMSPVEFVQHSGSNDLSHPERSIVLTPLPHVSSCLSSSA